MTSEFKSFNDLLRHCEFCVVCGKTSKVSFELGDLPHNWFDLQHSTFVDENILKFYGIIYSNTSIELNAYSKFEVLVPTEPGPFSVEADFFPESFEFCIEGFCNNCNSRRIVTENILVEKQGLSNFNIETETILTENFCIEIHYDEELIEISDMSSERIIATYEISNFKFDLKNLKAFDAKMKKYLLIS